jgi:RNA polymerase sigma-70 factor, ECF subfamily
MSTAPGSDLPPLIAQIRNGSHSAFKEFFSLFFNDVRRFLIHFTGDVHAADDLTQETFLHFWQARERLKDDLPIKGYLFRIARNCALNHVTRKPPTVRTDFAEDHGLRLYQERETSAYRDVFLAEDIRKGIALLPERCRMVFVLSRYHDMSYAEIAETMSISLQTVKNQMNKAIAVLRTHLADYLH